MGYGNISASTSSKESSDSAGECAPINAICALEALFGIIYVGLCGASILMKLLRMQANAEATFSNCIVVRFYEHSDDECTSQDLGSQQEQSKLLNENKVTAGFPVLEFRILNDLANLSSPPNAGVLVDASLSCLVCIDSKIDGLEDQKRIKTSFSGGESLTASVVKKKKKKNGMKVNERLREGTALRVHSLNVELKITPNECTFFKREWIVQHVLDTESPLLKPFVKIMIKENGGQWPPDLEELSACITNFSQINVNMNATSNTSGITVFARKVYAYSVRSVQFYTNYFISDFQLFH